MTRGQLRRVSVRIEAGRIKLAGAGWGLEVDPHVPVQVALVTGAVLTHGAHEGLLPGVDLEVAVQQRLPDESLAASRPGAGVALGVDLPGV